MQSAHEEKSPWIRQTRENCSRTEQISRHSPTITAGDANSVQSAHKRGTFSGPGSEPKEQRITQVSHNSFWVKYNHTNSTQFAPFSLPSLGQSVYRAKVRITRISYNSFLLRLNHANSVQFALNCVLSLYSAENRNRGSKFA